MRSFFFFKAGFWVTVGRVHPYRVEWCFFHSTDVFRDKLVKSRTLFAVEYGTKMSAVTRK